MATGRGDVNLSEETFDVICTICSKKRLIKEAVEYCIDCSKNLCDRCARIHVEHNDGHTLVGGSDEEADEASVLAEKCSKHGVCGNMSYMTEVTEYMGTENEIQRVAERLVESIKIMEMTIKSLNCHIEGILKNETNALGQIEDHARRVIERVDYMKRNSRTEVAAKCQLLLSEPTHTRDECMAAKSDMDDLVDAIEQSDQNQAKLFILSKKGERMIKMADVFSTKCKSMVRKSRLAFRSYKEFEEVTDRFNVLGRVVEPYIVSQKDSINIRIKPDTDECVILGCCLLADGSSLALLDNRNNALKHVNLLTGSVIGHCDMQLGVSGVTCISQHEVVICNESRDVQVVSIASNKLKLKRTIKLNHGCIKIAYSNGELFITDNECIYVHDVTGQLIRAIRKDGTGEDLFSYIRDIAVNQDRDRIYVADGSRGLICVSRSGNVIFRCSAEELGLSWARGLCLDNAGNILICGWSSHNVVQVTDDGEVLGEIIRKGDGVVRPASMCYNTTTHRLYIGASISEMLVYHLA